MRPLEMRCGFEVKNRKVEKLSKGRKNKKTCELIYLVESTGKYKSYLYTVESWQKLQLSISKANVIISKGNSVYEDIEACKAELEFYISELEVRSDKLVLDELLIYADSINSINLVGTKNNTEMRWSNFITIRKLVKETLYNMNSTVNEIKMSIYQLNYFMNELNIV